MHVLGLALLVLGLLAAASTLAVYSYGRFARRARGAPSAALPAEPAGTALDRALAPQLKAHPGMSGLLLVADNLQAFALRALTARAAGRSLDLQYYFWDDDLTGGLLGREVIAAADRGVRVRILLDDLNTKGDDSTYLALDHHPNIEIRLFNPSRNRTNALKRGAELTLRAFRTTRRMHNKAWIADGRLAVVGGRNIGDAYFDASQESNFRDLDLAIVGPAVAQAESIFDAFWNSASVLPLSSLHKLRAKLRRRNRWRGLPALKARLDAAAKADTAQPYLHRLREDRTVRAMLAGALTFHWAESVTVVSDPPEKALAGAEGDWLGKTIFALLETAQQSLEIISPYFIPGEKGMTTLRGLKAEGVDVAVLTNSLAATDVMAVHGAYANYRKGLLAAGIRLFELKPEMDGPTSAHIERPSLFGSRGASLHTKAFTVDGTEGFVGSFNFDPRSLSLNTEMGVFFRHAALAGEVGAVFRDETAPQSSYRLVLRDGRIAWQDGNAPERRSDPKATIWRRMAAAVIGFLPIESQL